MGAAGTDKIPPIGGLTVARLYALFVIIFLFALIACDPFSADPGGSTGCSSGGCTISGHVETEAGKPLGQVSITIRAGSHRVFGETDDNGNFSITGAVMTRDYCVIPSKGPWEFDPPEHCIKDITKNIGGKNFVAAHIDSFDISGQVFNMQGPLNNVVVLLTGHASKSVRTNQHGFYAFYGLRGREDYTVFPSKTGYTFEPVERAFTYLDSVYDDEDFLGTPVD
jgi:hypothetical protein